MGLSALITPLIVAQKLIRLDVPLMVGLSFLMLFLGLDGQIGQLDGALLFMGITSTPFGLFSRAEKRAAKFAKNMLKNLALAAASLAGTWSSGSFKLLAAW